MNSTMTYRPPALDPEKQTAVRNGEYDFLLPYAKPLYRTDEVADAICRDQEYVRKLIDAGRLEAHRDSSIAGGRLSSRVTRRSLLLYLAETANYRSADIVTRIEAIIKTLPPTLVKRVADSAQRQFLPHVNITPNGK